MSRPDRRLIPLMGACVAVALGGCGESTLVAGARAISFTADHAVPGSTIAQAAKLLDGAAQSRQALREELDALANSEDPYGRLMTNAFCNGMSQVAARSSDAAPTEDQWRTFLMDELRILAPNSPPAVIEDRVNVFVNASDLAAIHPQLAKSYLQSCLARPR